MSKEIGGFEGSALCSQPVSLLSFQRGIDFLFKLSDSRMGLLSDPEVLKAGLLGSIRIA